MHRRLAYRPFARTLPSTRFLDGDGGEYVRQSDDPYGSPGVVHDPDAVHSLDVHRVHDLGDRGGGFAGHHEPRSLVRERGAEHGRIGVVQGSVDDVGNLGVGDAVRVEQVLAHGQREGTVRVTLQRHDIGLGQVTHERVGVLVDDRHRLHVRPFHLVEAVNDGCRRVDGHHAAAALGAELHGLDGGVHDRLVQ